MHYNVKIFYINQGSGRPMLWVTQIMGKVCDLNSTMTDITFNYNRSGLL